MKILLFPKWYVHYLNLMNPKGEKNEIELNKHKLENLELITYWNLIILETGSEICS